jgi:glycerol-3-phosphate dehydrogenase (NAD(P)+)
MARISILGVGGWGTALAEGVPTTQSGWELAAKAKVETPIMHSIYSILYEKLPPADAVNRLLTRGLRPEAD